MIRTHLQRAFLSRFTSSGSKMIVLYDIPSPVPRVTWSPNAWKARFILNFKGLAHRTEWVEYPDIEATCKSLGALPTATRSGKPLYTIPTIHDLSTGKVISDSFEIAKYLDDTYPDTPQVLPKSARGLHSALHHALRTHYLSEIFRFVIPAQKLNPVSAEYYVRTKMETYGVPWEDIAPKDRKAAWKGLEEQMSFVDAWYAENGSDAIWIMGDKPTFIDFVLAGYFAWTKDVLPEEYAAQVEKWHEGRWGRLVDAIEKYNAVY